jgi:hypothetical protein
MPIWRLQTSFMLDSTLPRDRCVITPHFNDGGVGSDPQNLCEDLAAALDTWSNGTQEINVTAYDAEGTPPVYPAGDATVNAGVAGSTDGPREVAVCLSFYSERNIPRQRGRLFIPYGVLGVVGNITGVRPNSATQVKVGDLAAIFADLGGLDVDWVVWSRADQEARPVSNWWVDDEWDTMRSRGLRATSRTSGTVGEG